MTWVSVSLRKMELKNRINNMESQLMDISQQLQSISDRSSSEQTKISLKSNYELGKLNGQHRSDIENIFSDDGLDCNKSGMVTSMLGGYFEDPSNPTAEEIAKLREEFGFSETELPDDIGNVNDIYDKLFVSDALEDSSKKLLGSWMLTSQYLDDKLEIQTLTQAESDTLKDDTDAQTQALEAQQEALQTQLKTARAEYDSLGEALDNDISKGAIKLV